MEIGKCTRSTSLGLLFCLGEEAAAAMSTKIPSSFYRGGTRVMRHQGVAHSGALADVYMRWVSSPVIYVKPLSFEAAPFAFSRVPVPSHHSLSYFYVDTIVRVSAEDSQEPDDAETSGVRVRLTSPDASDDKDKEVWCTAEEVLAMLLVGVKVRKA